MSDVDQALARLGELGLAAALEELLELKFAAWAALPDYAGGTRAEEIALARFVAICDVCRILGVNDKRPPDPLGGSEVPAAANSTVRGEKPHPATIGRTPDEDTPTRGRGRHRGRRGARRLFLVRLHRAGRPDTAV